ncbi:hypothetical protein FD13_GL001841 [Levilactobacillus senmaizukei DSM 21775 = NBRC 103853]|uniref:DUF4097 domain-containing protein n=1 Tax=Levilactobacillus senmaizukei DSM 21775 = NBRC 103853 TaxID=1423803 RepID=A0A0R2DF23_9LACO|nr:DUF4097 family beta strand repeat-containing protein [Levilactobacillus senmaizukei]KRN02616.1 hypothetical protein FD13_GL001841 [Levilactobacillus senmaizukei DSM 21775 = NBRC 103853]
MKKTTKIALICLGLGLVLAGIGWINHGDKSVVWSRDHRDFQVIEPHQTSMNPERYHKIMVKTKSRVTIQEGDANRVTVTTMTNHRKNAVKATVSDGTLVITGGQPTDRLSHFFIGFRSVSDSSDQVLVTVPRGTQLDDVTVEKSRRQISLRGIQAMTMKLNSVTDVRLTNTKVAGRLTIQTENGDVQLNRSQAQHLSLTAKDGDVTLMNTQMPANDNRISSQDGDIRLTENKLGGGTVSSGDGDLHLQNNRVTKTLKAYTGDGDITAHVDRRAGIETRLNDTDMGDISVAGHSQQSGYRLHPHAPSQYQLTSADGDITVSLW